MTRLVEMTISGQYFLYKTREIDPDLVYCRCLKVGGCGKGQGVRLAATEVCNRVLCDLVRVCGIGWKNVVRPGRKQRTFS